MRYSQVIAPIEGPKIHGRKLTWKNINNRPYARVVSHVALRTMFDWNPAIVNDMVQFADLSAKSDTDMINENENEEALESASTVDLK